MMVGKMTLAMYIFILLYISHPRLFPPYYHSRMPFPYVHFVNLLVHTFIFVSMFALFPILYYWSIPAVGIIALFYKGVSSQ